MNAEAVRNSRVSTNAPAADDAVWHALHDRTRREILDILRTGSMTTGDLCAHFDTTRFAVMKHLKVLHEAELIIIERRGRERLNHLNPVPIQGIYRRWIRPFERLPADRMLKLKKIAEQTRESQS